MVTIYEKRQAIEKRQAMRLAWKYLRLDLKDLWDNLSPFGIVYLTVDLTASYQRGEVPFFYIGQRELNGRAIWEDRYIGSNEDIKEAERNSHRLARLTINAAGNKEILMRLERKWCQFYDTGPNPLFYNRNSTGGGGGREAAIKAAATRRHNLANPENKRYETAPRKEIAPFLDFCRDRIPSLLMEADGAMARGEAYETLKAEYAAEHGWPEGFDAPAGDTNCAAWINAVAWARKTLVEGGVLKPKKEAPDQLVLKGFPPIQRPILFG